ncbi:MAG TPA: hypothetical protein PLP39_05000 [Flavobacterium lutivivi]|nr:hypothetical protein [Flavobacterium lutivivi]
MSKILIVDDNSDHSETIKHNLEIFLDEINSKLEVMTILPMKEPSNYFNFFQENEISVLIIDEKLNEKAIDESGPVDYKGSDLVSFLREKLKELPIFCISNYTDVEELKKKYKYYEDIINRKDFIEDTDKFAPKIWRSAQNFFNENLTELNEFNVLAREVSSGDKDPKKMERLNALQSMLEIPFNGFDDRTKWLNEYENQISKLEELKTKIEDKLNE